MAGAAGVILNQCTLPFALKDRGGPIRVCGQSWGLQRQARVRQRAPPFPRLAGGPGKEAAEPTVPTHGVELVVAMQPHLLAQPGLVAVAFFGASLPSLQS